MKDTYSLSVFGLDPTWEYRFMDELQEITQLTLDPGNSKPITLYVDVPSEFNQMPEKTTRSPSEVSIFTAMYCSVRTRARSPSSSISRFDERC